MQPNNIILIGFMGTGKSTVGEQLAQQLQYERCDLDEEIVKATGKTISQIFAEDGEEMFRQLESDVLRRLVDGNRRVIITGGGAVLRPENVQVMLQYGIVVALTAEEQEIIRRVEQDQNRPLLQGNVKEKVRELLQARAGAYDFAPVQVDTTGKTIEEIVDEITNA
ncbi:shikimate kinase [Brevibacillus laterosporus]|uniref:Shikimate kinase n=1 Tax=Brevibacillus laterosporus TaxID=1465 RepID=A0AAP8U536_BRELA|nr:shikimate kinase [Brevibacillus laterosporus]MBG9774374.1 shikimate kinase [Brevibacillus laterosporus]MED1663925.1 shikimate kinase [Brevibacillus laterosporus]MED1669355.1 shikimate kinase [Brevibacillus laterosporus]MED1719485.1 shikimate kinase [Brevibacillus laterosporus]PPA84616.1 shikimate kinase [Brevibacillus laterosporus]